MLDLAKAHDVLAVAIVLDLPEAVCAARNSERPDRDFGRHVIKRQRDQLRRSVRGLRREGFREVHVLSSVDDVDAVTLTRHPLRSDFRDQHGPFDLVGDVHGCRSELTTLLERLGYAIARDDDGRPIDAVHPDDRRVIFLGDLVDRGRTRPVSCGSPWA